MQINQVFDELHDDYTAKIMRWVPCYQNMVLDIAQYLPSFFKPKNILDLGCGNGITSQVLLKSFPEAHYTLVDASTEMITGCQGRFQNQTHFQYHQAFFQDLALSNQSFNLIVACLSIHHLKEEEKHVFFQKMIPWLKPGGYFIYSDLMVDATDQLVHEDHLQRWQAMATQQGTNAEEWQFLMDHYEAYDFPTKMDRQIDWLKTAGLKNVEVSFRRFGWTSLLGQK